MSSTGNLTGYSGGCTVTRIDYQWYWDLTNKVAAMSSDLTSELSTLDGSLDVFNSAGTHSTAGHTWATAYDQSASDIFELTSLTAIAAGNLAAMIHGAGKNHADAENKNAPNDPVEIPGTPQSTDLQNAIHPTGFSAGGLDDKPSNWSIVEEFVTKKWADPDTGKIRSAGTAFNTLATSIGNISIPKTVPDDPPPDVAPINGAVDRLYTALREVTFACDNMKKACDDTAKWSDLERTQIRALLGNAELIIGIIRTLPRVPGRAKDSAINAVKAAAARDVDTLLNELDSYISGPPPTDTSGTYPDGGTVAVLGTPNPLSNDATKRGGTYGHTTSAAQVQLAPLLGRFARQVDQRRLPNGTTADKVGVGAEGERRAGYGGPKRRVTVVRPDGTTQNRFPDSIDEQNRQIVEVKNTNTLSTRDINQIKDSVHYAEGGNADKTKYSVVLVVDHRTQIPPAVQDLVNQGQMTVVREELFDNLPRENPRPQPFIPRENWTPPNPRQTQPYTGIPVP